jgi:polysaccharide biosynthesis protein PelA
MFLASARRPRGWLLLCEHLLFGMLAGLLLHSHAVAATAATLPSVALHYGARAPLAALKAFDIAVVEPDHGADPQAYRSTGRSELFAYVSVGEVHPTRSYAARIPDAWRIGRNPAWKSIVIDQSLPAWHAFFADDVVEPLWARGYRGFFLDTLDSYRLAAGADEAAQQRGIVALIRLLRERFPGIRLILNRGFELLPALRGDVYAVAAESLYRGWDAGKKRYTEVAPADREWLLGQLRTAREQYGVTTIAIDYVEPGAVKLARDTARRILGHGIVPYVTDAALEHLGVGLVEVLPRKVLFLYNGAETPGAHTSSAHRYAEMPVNHMGYVAEYVDINGPLPDIVSPAEYAGVLAWFGGYVPAARVPELSAWLSARIADGTRVAVIGSFGFQPEGRFARHAGLRATPPPRGALEIVTRDPMMDFESPAIPDRRELDPLRTDDADARVLLRVTDSAGSVFDGAAFTRWGGYVLNPFALRVLPGALEQTRWVVDPFAFIRLALALPDLPVPDTTTLNGRRIFFAHIDGDGFASRSEMPGRRLAAEVLLEEVLKRYKVPHAMSVIEREVSPQGAYPDESPQMEAVARRMFALPNVEIASHSYTHPFYWDAVERGEARVAEQGYTLAPDGYVPTLEREIIGSTDYIRSRLAPPGKPVALMLWSGDARPTEKALAMVADAGMLNMNGGNTIASLSYPSLSAVSALGKWRGARFHVHAPIMNENVYTNLWTGPYYGFEHVTETFDFTGSPRRLKPIDIYYHTYSASKRASLTALHKVYRHALAQAVHPLFPTEYVRIAMNFNDVVLARSITDGAIHVHGARHLRTLRAPLSLGVPDLAGSAGLAGYGAAPQGRYLHLAGDDAVLRFAGDAVAVPMLDNANAALRNWQRTADGASFRLEGHVPLEFSLANAQGCTVTGDGKALRPVHREAARTDYRMKDHAAQIELRCRPA